MLYFDVKEMTPPLSARAYYSNDSRSRISIEAFKLILLWSGK